METNTGRLLCLRESRSNGPVPAELALDRFIGPWTQWCHSLGQLSRNQAHGSPANWLDLYAAADITQNRGVPQRNTRYGAHDNDVLVYFPIHDLFRDVRRRFGEIVAINGQWLGRLQAVDTFRFLWDRGYAFDYVSDRQVAEISVDGMELVTPGGRYRALVVPPCSFLPLDTAQRLRSLTTQGASVSFVHPTARKMPGFLQHRKRERTLESLEQESLTHTDLEAALEEAGVVREPLGDGTPLLYIGRHHTTGRCR